MQAEPHITLLGALLAPSLGPAETMRLREAVSGIDWRPVLALASAHLVTPAVCAALAAKGLSRSVEGEVGAYLEAVLELNAARNRRMLAQLEEAVSALNALDVRPVLLKGMAHLRLGLYDDPAARMISDIDLLVPEPRLKEAVRALHRLGYLEATRDNSGGYHHHHPPLARGSDPALIELHRKVVEPRWARALPAEEVIAAASPATIGSGEALAPAPMHLMLHNVVHGQLTSGRYFSAELSLRDALDLVLIQRRWPEAIDWPALVEHLRAHRGEGALAFHVGEACRLLHAPVPDGLPATAGARFARWRFRRHLQGRQIWLQRLARGLAYEWTALQILLDNPTERRRLVRKVSTPAWYRYHASKVRTRMRGQD